MFKRNTMAMLLASVTLTISGLACAAPVASAETTVVIVHGAFADGSDWAKVVPLLQARGIKVRVVQNPLYSLSDDVAAAKRTIDNQPGKVVLVGHSWGGTVITEAGADNKVAALVYVAAFAPDAGQSTAEMGKDFPAPPGASQFVADAAGFLSLSEEGMVHDFAQDLPPEQARVMAAIQGPIQAKAFGEKTTVAAWTSKPSWFIVSANDRMIAPDLERAMAKKIGAKVTTLPTSHVPQQSRPNDVAQVIIDAVQTVSK